MLQSRNNSGSPVPIINLNESASNASYSGANINNTTNSKIFTAPATNSFAQILKKSNSKSMPIQLAQADRSVVNIASLQSNFSTKDFEGVKLKADAPLKIYPKDVQTKHQIAKLLNDSGHEFNTFAEKNEKRQSYIVRGLNYGNNENNISLIGQALIEVGTNGPYGISRFFSGHMKRNHSNEQSILYRIIIEQNDNPSGLAKIKIINGFRVVIEKMRKSLIVQCRRCQRFQHTAHQCSFNYRCVQCTSPHGPGFCPRHTNNKLPLQCCNCNAGGLKNTNHTANNLSECEFFKLKHSRLFDKYQKGSVINADKYQHPIQIAAACKTAITRATTDDLLLGPAPANNPSARMQPRRTAPKSTSTNQPNKNQKILVNQNSVSNIVPRSTTVHSGESRTDSVLSDAKLNALAGALVQVLCKFL